MLCLQLTVALADLVVLIALVALFALVAFDALVAIGCLGCLVCICYLGCLEEVIIYLSRSFLVPADNSMADRCLD